MSSYPSPSPPGDDKWLPKEEALARELQESLATDDPHEGWIEIEEIDAPASATPQVQQWCDDVEVPAQDASRVPDEPGAAQRSGTGPRWSWSRLEHSLMTPSRVLSVVVVLSLIAAGALAAVTVTYSTNTSVSLTTIGAPVVYEAGTSTSNRYVTGWSLSSNATYFSATIKGVPEANLTVDTLFNINNTDTSAHTVTLTLTGGVVSNAKITNLDLVFYDNADDSWVATWDLESSASINLGSMAASKVYYAKFFFDLDTGAGTNNVDESLSVSLSVT